MSSCKLLPLTLFLLLPFAFSHHWVWDVDFDHCYDEVKNLNSSDFTDSRQYFLFNQTTGERVHPERVLLTLQGCEETCHAGYGLWPAQDTLLRLVLWLLPAAILVGHFHFAPLPATNICQVIFHLLGDPIDSLWSMLTRQEANRRFFRRATTTGLLNGQPVATVWSAYDEIGWRDASTHFFESLRARAPSTPSPGSPMPSQRPRPADERSEDRLHINDSRGESRLKPLVRRLTTWGSKIHEAAQDTQFSVSPDNTEIYYIE